VKVLDQLTSEDMPPEDEKQPETSELTRMSDWISGKLQNADQGKAYRQKLLAQEYGNWVSHEKLFSGEIDTPPFSPSRRWRYSPEFFDRKGFGKAQSPFTYITPEKGIRDYASTSTADRSTVQMVLINAEQFLEERDKKGEFKAFADDQPMPVDEVLAGTVDREFRRIVGRDPMAEERPKYLAFLKKNIEVGGNADGLKTMIKAIFLNPDAIYRMEFGLGSVDEYGRRHLSPEEMVYALAYALAYALTDELPERSKPIWSVYKEGTLNNQEDAARVVRQMLDEQLGAGPWSDRKLPRIMRFFLQFFGFDRAGDVFKDNDRQRLEAIPQWNTGLLVHDAQMLIERVLKKDKDVIAELLTTNEYFIAHPGDNDYAREFYEQQLAEVLDPGYVDAQIQLKRQQLDNAQPHQKKDPKEVDRQIAAAREKAESKVRKFKTALEAGINPHPEFPFTNRSRGIADLIYIAPYNLPATNRTQRQLWNWPIEQPLKMPAEQRSGLLTHPAWLAAWSVNDGNDAIHRGIWVYEKLLAGKLQDVPPDVDAKVPIDPHKTLRERMGFLREERCWNCHHKINPLGETFEMFDDWGRYRVEDFFGEDGTLVTRRDGTFDRLLKEGKLTPRKVDAT
jgi:hypothetical protein